MLKTLLFAAIQRKRSAFALMNGPSPERAATKVRQKRRSAACDIAAYDRYHPQELNRAR